MSDRDLADLVPSLSEADRTALVLRYWRRGALTPLAVANSLASARPRSHRSIATRQPQVASAARR